MRRRIANRPRRNFSGHKPSEGIDVKRQTQSRRRVGSTKRRRMAYLRGKLLEKRRELLRRLVSELNASAMALDVRPADAADQASFSSEREAWFWTGSFESHTVQEIDHALERLENGTYNICEECGRRIPETRLRALPFASTCLRCQERLEREATAQEETPDWEAVAVFGGDGSHAMQDAIGTIRGRRPG